MKKINVLGQLGDGLIITDGGLETTLIFHEGIDIPYFAAVALLKDPKGYEAVRAYYGRYLAIAGKHGTGFILESPTWRASPDWGLKLGWSQIELARANADSIKMMRDLQVAYGDRVKPILVSGCIGPRGDGYIAGEIMTVAEAADYHSFQAGIFAKGEVDLISAITMTNVNEAIGIVKAAHAVDTPAVISFTVETDGCLPTGQSLADAVAEVDGATQEGPAYYMINCAHPEHFAGVLDPSQAWVQRVRGIRANASKRSHQELNDAPDLDIGNPAELGGSYRALLRRLPQIKVVGGCCGTDERHIEQIACSCRIAA